MLLLLLLLLSHFSCVRLYATPWTAPYQASPSMGFSRQEHWSGVPFPSPMHESGKWKWSRSVMSDSQRPHELQPTSLLRPWDFPGNSTGVGCHCLLLLLNGWKHIQIMYLIKGGYPKYIFKNSYNFTVKKKKQNPKNKQSEFKNGQRNWIDIFPEKTSKWLTGKWKVLNITTHQVNTNQSHNEISPRACLDCYYQEDKKYSVLVRIRRKRNCCKLMVGIIVIMENSLEVTQKIK